MKPGSRVEHKYQGLFRTAAVVFIATMLSACGSSTSPSSNTTATGSPSTNTTATGSPTNSGTSFDSCSVVTQEDAASALRETVTAGVAGTATVEGGSACVFYGPSAPKPQNPDVAQSDSVRVVVVKGPDAARWYNDYKSKVKAQPVNGYGDQAYYDGHASLNVLKGTSYLRVAVVPAVGSPSLSDEEQLAAAILGRL